MAIVYLLPCKSSMHSFFGQLSPRTIWGRGLGKCFQLHKVNNTNHHTLDVIFLQKIFTLVFVRQSRGPITLIHLGLS